MSIKVDNLNQQNNELCSKIKAALELISTEKPSILPTESHASTFVKVAKKKLNHREHMYRKKNLIHNLKLTRNYFIAR